jgi:hypothetical protein
MKNREAIFRRIEQIEGKLKNLNFMCTRNTNVNDFTKEISNVEEILADLKSMVEREPMGTNEINYIPR